MSINIQSLHAKFAELTTLIKYLREEHNFNFSIICLQETWLKQDSDKSQLQIPNYEPIMQGKQCSHHGGLAIYVHEEFKGKERKLYKKSDGKLWEGQCINVTGERLTKNVCISNIYRPPRFNNNNRTITDFLTEFSPYVEKLESENVHNIILGDFNINLLQLQNREKIEEYYDKFMSSGFIPRITLPTRFSTKGCTLIDQIFCNFEKPTQKCTSAILTTKISDHLPCILSFNINPKVYKAPKFITITDNSEKNTERFIEGITKEISENKIDEDPYCNPNITYNTLDEIIKNCQKKYFPEKIVRFNKYRHKIKPWITKDTMNSIKNEIKCMSN